MYIPFSSNYCITSSLSIFETFCPLTLQLYFIPTLPPPSPPSLSISILYLSIYLSLYSHSFSPLNISPISLTYYIYLSIFIPNFLVSFHISLCFNIHLLCSTMPTLIRSAFICSDILSPIRSAILSLIRSALFDLICLLRSDLFYMILLNFIWSLLSDIILFNMIQYDLIC